LRTLDVNWFKPGLEELEHCLAEAAEAEKNKEVFHFCLVI